MTRLWLNVVVPDTVQQIFFSVPLSLPCLGFCLVTLLVRLDFFSIEGLSAKYRQSFI